MVNSIKALKCNEILKGTYIFWQNENKYLFLLCERHRVK